MWVVLKVSDIMMSSGRVYVSVAAKVSGPSFRMGRRRPREALAGQIDIDCCFLVFGKSNRYPCLAEIRP